ncbi:MAG: SLC13 family permease [Candidatus Palauibacterales bacterium]|nr:SLC13 family permease [Candidatus Palauibacterales bacterium]
MTESGETEPAGGIGARVKWAARLLGPLIVLSTLVVPGPAGLSTAGWRTMGVGLLMALWWVTEALPIPATAILPLALFPVLGIAGIDQTAAPYANDLIFLFMGGFMIALAMERWDLPRRISLLVIRTLGTRPRRLIAGFMLSTAFFSMWVSNTATTLMMLPIGLSVIHLVERGSGSGDPDVPAGAQREFAVALMLGIAYAASIGGVGTIIGTPPNAFMAGYISETYGVEVGFARWMGVAIPLVAVALPVAYVLLTRVLFPLRLERIPGGRELIEGELEDLGSMSTPERRVAGVFVLTALTWVTRPLLEEVIPGLSDAGIAMAGALILFLVPSGADAEKRRDARERAGVAEPGDEIEDGAEHAGFLLNWTWAKRLPWGILLLFGGGLSLAGAISDTGLTGYIGGAVGGLSAFPTVAIVAVATAVTILLTELTSNTATSAAFLPIMASVAVGIGESPFLLVIPAALAASCAFMLPVATPPNAIVFGSGRLSIPQMAKAGVWLNLIMVGLITLLAYSLLPVVFDVVFGSVPAWAG